ncbi:MAG: hypothetical protein HYY40_10825 [Bacteroidetes bacterium]|nr:hypothetical protein [Bacteroidota bacterium]
MKKIATESVIRRDTMRDLLVFLLLFTGVIMITTQGCVWDAPEPIAPSCSDGIQNQDETGVDCGGPCAACDTTCDTCGVDTIINLSTDIQPIFDAKCATANCHDAAGGYASGLLNLTAGTAWGELWNTGTNKPYVNPQNPTEKPTSLYTKINTGGTMYLKCNDDDRAKILKWIQQGALNN